MRRRDRRIVFDPRIGDALKRAAVVVDDELFCGDED